MVACLRRSIRRSAAPAILVVAWLPHIHTHAWPGRNISRVILAWAQRDFLVAAADDTIRFLFFEYFVTKTHMSGDARVIYHDHCIP
jgi:hypothetical protein